MKVVYCRYTYDSRGRLILSTNANGGSLGTGTLGYQNSVRYRGYVYDHETGLYYLQSRYYDAETGRFLNADDVDYIGYSGEQLSYNAFAYCENNAVNSWDPWGYENNYIYVFAKDLSLIYNSYSIYRTRSGKQYMVTLGSAGFKKTGRVNFYYGSRTKFYKQLGFKYTTKTEYYTIEKETRG